MDGDELRERQTPAQGTLSRRSPIPRYPLAFRHGRPALGDRGGCSVVQTGHALVEAGLHEATGGDGSLACSGDMLLQALVGCAGVTLRSVATNRGIEVTGTGYTPKAMSTSGNARCRP